METSDGARLRCSVAVIGRGTEPRWVILDSKGEQFVGPRVGLDRTEAGVTRLIDEWWRSRGQPQSGQDSAAETGGTH